MLRATIVGSDGAVVYDYREFNGKTMRIQAEDGSWIEVRRPPELRVKGVLYGSSTPEQLAVLRSLASSREGKLIRRLGLGLLLAAPGPELVDERRGLELATQALWPYFPPGGPPAPQLTVDYEVSVQGYVVLTQPYDLVLATNYEGSRQPSAEHDDDMVNGCFGRCGSGCTGGFAGIDLWPSHWTDTYGDRFVAQQRVLCIAGEDWRYTLYTIPINHSVDGWWTPGCQLHDNCCRLNPVLCWTVCNAVAPLAPLSDPLGEVRNWTYTDYAFGGIRMEHLGSSYSCPSDLPPVASFSWRCTGLDCTFYSNASDDRGISTWSWDFGEGTTRSGSVVYHTFPFEGTFTVSLTVTDTAGQTDQRVQPIAVHVITCGDALCENGEDSINCPYDCGTCGNFYCDPGEDSFSCPDDCGDGSTCGNFACEAGEDEFNCPSDCCVPGTCQ